MKPRLQDINQIETLLIDADMLVYTMGFASDKHTSTEFAGGFMMASPTGGLKENKALITGAIHRYLRLFPLAVDYKLCLSGSTNWRYDFYPEYKANRKTLKKPGNYSPIRDWLKDNPNCVFVEGEEADDWMAERNTNPGYFGNCIVSADKDFFTVPGFYYSLSSKRLFKVKKEQSFSFLFFQALAGDRVDGYYGVTWVGLSKAIQMLKRASTPKLGNPSVRSVLLSLKAQVVQRVIRKLGKKKATRVAKREAWGLFRQSLDLAALRWNGEVGSKGIGYRRIWANRSLDFEYFLPYYDITHTLKFGLDPLGGIC